MQRFDINNIQEYLNSVAALLPASFPNTPQAANLTGSLTAFVIVALFASLTVFIVYQLRHISELPGVQFGAVLVMTAMWILLATTLVDVWQHKFAPPPAAVNQNTDPTPLLWYKYSIPAAILLALLGVTLILFKLKQHLATVREANAELTERKERLEQAAGLAKLGYYLYDTIEEKITFCTEQHARSHGVSLDEYLRFASTLSNEMPLIHPDDRKILKKKYKQVLKGKTIEVEYRVPTARGEKRIREITQPVLDENGIVVREIGTTLDITDIYRTEQKLKQTHRLEAIGQLTGGVAHDFNNLLAVTLGNLELLDEICTDEQSQRYINSATYATNRGAKLARNLLSFSRQATLEPVPLNLNQIVCQTKNWAERILPSTIEIETSLLAGLWNVVTDPGTTENALLNLILNARDAMPNGGKLTLETQNVRIDDTYIWERNEDISEGRYVLLAVSDTGHGIPSNILHTVFEPFYSTKPVGKGSGLGLSMVQGFMKQSGGTVQVYSEEGRGTTFKLYFQAVDVSLQAPAPTRNSKKVTSDPTLTHVLLVEDQDELREILTQSLQIKGYTVVSASSGDAALELYPNLERIDIVVSDIVMPGSLQGIELVSKLRELQPDLAAIFLTGYAQEATVHAGGLDSDDIRLMKPVNRRTLYQAIDKALERKQEEA